MSTYSCDNELADKLKPGINTLRVIISAMVLGAGAFLLIACTLRLSAPAGPVTATMSLLRWVAIGLAPLAFIAGRALSAWQVHASRQQLAAGTLATSPGSGQGAPAEFLAELGDAGILFGVYTTQALISAACIELATFACVFSFMFTGSLASLALSLGLMIAIAVSCFPFSAHGVAQWVDEQLRLMEEERMRIR